MTEAGSGPGRGLALLHFEAEAVDRRESTRTGGRAPHSSEIVRGGWSHELDRVQSDPPRIHAAL